MTRDSQQCGICDQQSLRSACAYAQSDQSLCLSLAYPISVKLLTELHLEFLGLKGGSTDSSESTLVKMPHCWKSHVMAHIYLRVVVANKIFFLNENNIQVDISHLDLSSGILARTSMNSELLNLIIMLAI